MPLNVAKAALARPAWPAMSRPLVDVHRPPEPWACVFIYACVSCALSLLVLCFRVALLFYLYQFDCLFKCILCVHNVFQ